MTVVFAVLFVGIVVSFGYWDARGRWPWQRVPRFLFPPAEPDVFMLEALREVDAIGTNAPPVSPPAQLPEMRDSFRDVEVALDEMRNR